MTHDEARELLLDLAYEELGPDDRQPVEEHVGGCAECAAELARLRQTRAAAGVLPDPAPVRGRAELVEAARRAVTAPPAPRRARWSRPAAWMAVAATVVVVGGLTVRWLGAGPGEEASTGRVVAAPPAAGEPAREPASAAPLAPSPARRPSPESPAVAQRPPPAPPAPRAASPQAGALASREMADARAGEASAFPPGTSGAFVSLDLRSGAYFRVNPAGCATRYPPYSTFKIPASLIALETGVVKDPSERWRWDPARYPAPSPAPGGDYVGLWQQDQDLRTALARSIVWYFREVASRVGEPRMKQWLATFDYGNQDLSGGLDRFWLGSSLRISPDEQVAFLAGLQRGRFPVQRRNLELVQEILAQDAGPGWRLVAKTGSAFTGEGWLVGWVEAAGGGCAFALHLQASSFEEMARFRSGLARELLQRAGCIPR